MTNKRGFTLIELLVVISILGVLAGLIVNNLNDSRARARDARRKQNLNQMKTALRLYYNDYQVYPESDNCGSGKINYIKGCGDDGDECCPCSDDLDFAAGTSCATTYMPAFPDGFGANIVSYYSDASEQFVIKVSLENASDPDITTTQTQCNTTYNSITGYDLSSTDYAICSN